RFRLDLDDGESADQVLLVRERSVQDRDLARLLAHAGTLGGGKEAVGRLERAGPRDLGRELHHLRHLLLGRWCPRLHALHVRWSVDHHESHAVLLVNTRAATEQEKHTGRRWRSGGRRQERRSWYGRMMRRAG